VTDPGWFRPGLLAQAGREFAAADPASTQISRRLVPAPKVSQ